MAPTNELVGRRVRVLAWYDHASLVATPWEPDGHEGTITHVYNPVGEAVVSVRVDGQVGVYTFKFGDMEVLPLVADVDADATEGRSSRR